ncbi:MAG: NifB/NifX family molybdenum-iron cluster-binding protein [Acidobacteria bacterium]|nr:NifB/NifX family molybdenum-iron cluster-binding protein [Acidobacteriota bacterium]
MRIAIPVANGRLCAHFGHCESFAIIDVDMENNSLSSDSTVEAPPHQPGLLPPWLVQHGVTMVIAGGMGFRAQQLFTAQGIKVLVGAPTDVPAAIVQAWLDGRLQLGDNLCDH